MAKATVMGCCCVVVSSLTPEEIERFKRFDPEDAVLKGEGADFTLKLDEGKGPGSLKDDCATYSRTKSADGKATITILLDPEADDKPGMVRNKIGAPLLKLEQLERQMESRKGELAEMEKSADALIELM